ncbi:MAG: excisionase [Lachnospiraceae bacterium]|nr:excisionase [Lachnospiraceae bacterium]
MNEKTVPIWEKYVMTIEEAAAYFRIGENRIRQLVNENPYGNFYLRNGNRVLIKRKLFEQYIDSAEAV